LSLGLEEAVGLQVENLTLLEALEVPDLDTGVLDVLVKRNDALATLDLGGLVVASRDIEIADNPSLSDLDLGLLESAESLEVQRNAVSAFDLPLLRTATTVRLADSVATRVDLGGLLAADDVVVVTPSASSVDLTDLASVGDVTILSGAVGSFALPSIGTADRVSIEGPSVVSLPLFDDGTVAVTGPDLTALDVPLLRTGGLVVEGTGLTRLALTDALDLSFFVRGNALLQSVDLASPVGRLELTNNDALTSVVVDIAELRPPLIVERNAALTALDLSGLQRVVPTANGRSSIAYNPLLTSVDLSQLTEIGDVRVVGGDALSDLRLDGLQRSGILEIQEVPALTAVTLPALTRADWLLVQRCAGLERLELPALVDVPRLDIRDADALTTLDFASLTTIGPGFGLAIFGNASLSDLSGFDALTTIQGRLDIIDNPSLPTATATAFAQGLTVSDGVSVQGNL
ncbi:MAG: hypothetical protein AAF602_19690, partial [Myxococcota bacterium]